MSPVGVRHFHEELARLKTQLLEMSGLAEELVAQAMAALRARDPVAAAEVIRRDNDLDAMEMAVDDMCIHLLALQQPMARDLRLITMAMKISNDLERVGDHAVNIAEAVPHLAESPVYLEFQEIEEMGRLATEMLTDALDTFVKADAAGAREVCRRDDRVDGLHESLFRILLTHMMEDPRRIGASMSMFLVSRNLERIADLATNIAEDVVFLVEGRTIKHGGARLDDQARAS
ncbi:phosphate signaling complex protein PhoU [Longimicrobium sp.]|uniref:phosphate signaling complex protein PhoU n=1 Tax=Longimicrobium sp. TaxID=2029185 RepID=UPI002E33E5AF|nr:phosphate signaling complex protein PhoU [Longimicrobium sp.]HEX6037451.1 phosphate signaling complex protein PhoU [Longimicrobium sp.]